MFSVTPAETGTNHLARRGCRPDCARLRSEREVYQKDNRGARHGTRGRSRVGRAIDVAQS